MTATSGTERRAWDWIVVFAWMIGIAATVYWFFTAARQALPVFDDFCRASFHPTTEFRPAELPSGFGNALSWSYQNWSGRWAGTALGMLVLGTANIEAICTDMTESTRSGRGKNYGPEGP